MDRAIPSSIARRTMEAEAYFSDIIRRLSRVQGEPKTSLSPETVTDVAERFRLWAGNIGAKNERQSRFSLESRLIAAGELLEQVTDLLDELGIALSELHEIVAGARENRSIERVSSTSSLEDPERDNVWVDEAQDVLDIASECVRSLLRISILIRRATPRDRFARALRVDSAKHNLFPDQFDIDHVAHRFPKLNRPESRWLCERLGRAITKRRQFLRYSREHASRIAGNADEERTTRKAKPLLQFAVGASNTPSVASGTTCTRPSTKVSTLNPSQLGAFKLNEAEQHETRSYVSAGSSFQTVEGAYTSLRLPSLLDVSKGGTMFECPLCWGIQTFSREREWWRHAFQDLRAYVCTLGDSECDSRLFADSKAWFDHELECHRGTWTCILCQDGPFGGPGKMEEHAKESHGNIVVEESQLKMVVNASQRGADSLSAQDCPFCDEWAESLRKEMAAEAGDGGKRIPEVGATQFRRHVASHQEQLALFAVPSIAVDDESEVAGDGSFEGSVVRSKSSWKRRRDWPLGRPGIDHIDEQLWLPDPPLHIAAAAGDLARFEQLLEEGADIDMRGETWGTVLDAARASRLQLSEEALKNDPFYSAVSKRLEEHRTLNIATPDGTKQAQRDLTESATVPALFMPYSEYLQALNRRRSTAENAGVGGAGGMAGTVRREVECDFPGCEYRGLPDNFCRHKRAGRGYSGKYPIPTHERSSKGASVGETEPISQPEATNTPKKKEYD